MRYVSEKVAALVWKTEINGRRVRCAYHVTPSIHECQLRNLRSYSKDRFSIKCCRGKESQVEKCPKPRPTKSWLSLFKKREPSAPEDGESKPPKRSTSWLTFWRQPEIDVAPLPPRYTCRLELERRRYKGELTALKEGRTPHAWEPDVMVITEDCHDPIVCHSMTEAYPHQPPRPHPNRLARCRSSERRQTRYKDARLQETKPDEEWRHIKDQGAFYMAVRTECPRKEDPPAGYRRRTCPEHKGIEMRSSRLSWCEAVKNIEMDSVAEFPKPKTYEPTPRKSKGAVIPECTLRKDGTSSPLATQDRFQEPVHVSREVSTLQTRTCGGVRKVPTREYREEVNDTRLQEIPYGREDASSEVTDHNAEKDPECRVEPTKTPDAMEVSEVVCDQAKNSPDRVEKSLISEEEKGDTMTTSGHCLSSYLKNKEGKPNACKHKLCVEECAPRAFPKEGGCDSVDLKEKCVEDSRRVVPPTNDPESMIADPDARVKCDISKPSPDDSKKPRGRNFSTLSSSLAFSLDHHSTMPLIRNSCRSVACKMMHTSTKTNMCVSSVLRKKDRRWCDGPLDSDPVQGKTKKLDQHVCEKQSSGSVNISNSGKCGKEGKPNLVCSKKKNVETKQRPGSEIAVNVLECKDRPSKKVKNSLSKNYAPVRSTKLEDNNIKLKKLARCPTVEKTMPPPACSPDQKRHKLPEERKSKECLEEIKLKECLKVEVEVAPPSCKGKENTKNCNLQKSTDICDSKNTSKRSMNSTTKMRKSKKGGKKAISHSSFSIYSLDNKFKTHLKFQGYCRNMSSDEQSHMPRLKNPSFRNEEYSTLFYGSLPKQFTKGSFNGSRIHEPIEYLKTRQPERKVPDFNLDHTTFLRKTNYTPQPVKKFLHASALGLKSKDSKKTGKKGGKRALCEMKEPESLDCPAVILPGCSQPESIACSRERKIEHVSECHRIPTISNAECVKDHPPTPLPSECDCPSNAYKSSLSGYNSFNSSPLIYSGEATFNKASANMVVHERQVGLNKSQSLPKVITSFKSNLRYVRVRPLETKEWQPTIRSTSKKQVKRKCEKVRLKTRPSKVQDETGLPTKEKVLCNQISDPEWHIKPNEEEKVSQAFRSDEKQKFEKITESNKTQIIVPNVTQISNATETTFLRRMKTWFSFLVPTPGVKEAGNNNLNDSVTIHHQSHVSQERKEKPDKNRDDDILKHTLSEVCVNNPNKDDHSSPVAEEIKNSFILDETQVDIKPTETKFKVDTAKVELFIPNINVQNGEKWIKSEQNKVLVSQNTTESIKLHALNASQRTIGVEAENTSAKKDRSITCGFDTNKERKGNMSNKESIKTFHLKDEETRLEPSSRFNEKNPTFIGVIFNI
uniref:Uncharacterized protein n=1 Tax=Timema bartmani TaxID=61472 RepID=A0A7R9EUJ5_9NEOP|nr:unnamed protein product [Timema bartmani]